MATCWCKPGDIGWPCHAPAEATALPPVASPPSPLPQRTAEGLSLLPVGELPAIPTAPVAPTAAAT